MCHQQWTLGLGLLGLVNHHFPQVFQVLILLISRQINGVDAP
jgi:hypothetical protein